MATPKREKEEQWPDSGAAKKMKKEESENIKKEESAENEEKDSLGAKDEISTEPETKKEESAENKEKDSLGAKDDISTEPETFEECWGHESTSSTAWRAPRPWRRCSDCGHQTYVNKHYWGMPKGWCVNCAGQLIFF